MRNKIPRFLPYFSDRGRDVPEEEFEMIRSLLIALLVILVACVILPAYGAEIYKWVDENGKVHFGDRPPANAEGSQEIEVKTAPVTDHRDPTDAQRRERRRRLLESFENERAEKKQAAAEEKERKKKNARQCTVAKHNLDLIKRAGYIYDLDESGEKVIYSDEEKDKEISDLQKSIKKYCK